MQYTPFTGMQFQLLTENTQKRNQLAMYRYGLCILTYLALLFGTIGYVMADEIPVGRFSTQGLTGWERKSFKGFTEYHLIQENGISVVNAVSHETASGLVKKINFDPKKYRYLHWSWKIQDTVPEGYETEKNGDDYAARIYVVFSGTFFWQTKAINYIWANHMNRGDSIPNAYTSSAIMVAVQSGPDKAGQWLTETRDIFSDYKNLFGSEPDQAAAIAIMTDTDDTRGKAIAWYGDITLSSDQ